MSGSILYFDDVITVVGNALSCGSPTMTITPGFSLPGAFDYNAAGSFKQITNIWSDILTLNKPDDCPLTSCYLLESGCATGAYLVHPDVSISSALPHDIKASETNPAGYSITFCFRCELRPWGTNNK